MQTKYSNFYHTDDNEQIHFTLNFKPEEIKRTPLIFNYGLVCSIHHWKYQIEEFDRMGFPIILHDYRGHYNSSGKDNIESLSFERMSQDINGLLEHIGIEKAIFLGHSMGVNICLEVAKNFPDKVEKMILISGTAFPVQNVMFDSNITDLIMPKLKEGLLKYPETYSKVWKLAGWNPLIKKIIHFGGFNLDTVSDEFVEIYLNKVGKLGPDIFFKLMDEMAKHDILASLKKLTPPTLIIGGNNDRVIPNWVQRTLKENLPHAELYIVKDGSHVPQVDFPEFINERIHFFLN